LRHLFKRGDPVVASDCSRAEHRHNLETYHHLVCLYQWCPLQPREHHRGYQDSQGQKIRSGLPPALPPVLRYDVCFEPKPALQRLSRILLDPVRSSPHMGHCDLQFELDSRREIRLAILGATRFFPDRLR